MQRVGRLMTFALIPLVVAGLAGCDRLPGAATDLQVGECFDEPAESTDISEVQRRPCNEPHDAEVFAVLNHPAGPDDAYPIISGVDDFVESDCLPIFETYTGTPYDSQEELDIAWLWPTMNGWRDGDREVTCYLISATDGQQLTGSQRAAP